MCSPKLRLELFTIAAIDNIDHNHSTDHSTSAQGSFHGTSISVFQHFQNESNGVERLAMTTSDQEYSHASRVKLEKLPHSYTNVPPVAMSKKDPILPKLAGPTKQIACCLVSSNENRI